MNKNSRENWSVEKGDYLREGDEHSKKHERIVKRILLLKRITLVLVYLAMLFIFLITLHLLAKI
ncbi:MAG: hypothetical protein R6W90_03015 [Ignavibacteriaceae bacterium]